VINKNYVIAIYLRLSLEDDGYGESESISNQRDLVNNYISSHNEFDGCSVLEFSDDGYSGTNFNRPHVTKMLKQAKSGKINCIIVKDFSRFGRNHIEVGDYIEQIFPFLGIRFISVNNNFDSKNLSMQTGTLDIAFTNLINDYYSKDVSKKVTSAKQAKMRKGDYMSTTALYGYRKMDGNKNRLDIDPVAAKYVHAVFELCLEGKSTGAIATELNAKNIPTPLAYKRIIGYERKWNTVNDTNFWTRAMVWKLLRDERYLGITISGKTKVMRVGSNKRYRQPKSEWIVVHDTHTPIISEESFYKAQELLGLKKERDANKMVERLLGGKVKCGCCGHTMRGRYDRERPYFFCETLKVHKSDCVSEKVYEDILSDIVLAFVRKYTACANSILSRLKNQASENIAKMAESASNLQAIIKKTKTAKVNLYESYKEGKLTRDMYIEKCNYYKNVVIKLQDDLEKLNCELTALRGKEHENQLLDNFKKLYNLPKLTPHLVSELVSTIKIYDINNIEITWNFCDDYQKELVLRNCPEIT